mgnify:CR=1 FL=1
MGTKNIISSLVEKINDDPNFAHLDYTSAVHELIIHKEVAVKAVLPLLNSEDMMERYRAQRVVEGVMQRKFGWKAGQGFLLGSDGEQQFLKLWIENGNYNAEASEEDRLKAINKWKAWLEKNKTDGK